MFHVPKDLMISPPRCRSDERIGHVFSAMPQVRASTFTLEIDGKSLKVPAFHYLR